MSNLKLPNLDYKSLLDANTSGVVAYKTSVGRFVTSTGEPIVSVLHHATTIAMLGRWHVSLDTGGYDSTTTANRLNRIIRDNHIPFFVGIKNGHTVIRHQDDKRTIVAAFTRARFDLIGGTWVLTNTDGRNPYVQGVELNSAAKPCMHPSASLFACPDGDEQCLECGAIRTPIDSPNALRRHLHPNPVWHRPINPAAATAATSGTAAL